jgi:DNA transposition AAA+ family ATPase
MNENDENKLKIVGAKPLWDEELRGWLEKYIREHPHHSPEVLARSQYIGVPRIIIEDYLEGTYFLPKKSGGKGNSRKKSNIEEAIWHFRHTIEGTARHNYKENFLETRTWVQVQNACNTAINRNAIVVVYGKPGIGKTRCLLEYVRRNTITAPVLILCSRNITPLYFVQKLARKTGLSERAVAARLEDNIAERLMRTPRPLFIDQANYLGEKSLGTICHIWEVARVPVVLAGTKSLYELFITSQETEDARAQLSSRVAMHYPLTGLLLSEAKAVIQRELGRYATDEAVALLYNITRGLPRYMEMLLFNLQDLITRNSKELEAGSIKLSDLITKSASRLMLD